MKGRKLLIGFIGVTQEAIGVLTIVFCYVLYYNLFDVLNWLNIAAEHVALYVLILSVFGFVFIISGFFLIRELLE
ncbi:MAG: hypothetical protein OEX77_00700 [Candidatus Bathyarchaeota archaeon]|nr:hypothetical protein [Candidatus Bathyarchaeota archaeon]